MQVDFSDFEGNLYDCTVETLAALGVTCKVIFANQGKPDPKGTTLYLNILGMNQVGQKITGSGFQSITVAGSQGSKFYAVQYQADIQFTIVGDNAFTVATELHTNMKSREGIYSIWYQHSLPILTKSNLRSSPQLMQTKWVDGYSFDVKCNFIINREYNEYTVGKVSVGYKNETLEIGG